MEHVILFAGPMGAGKTTAIRSLSDIPVISTEAMNFDRTTSDKATTTVALDYGEIHVSGPTSRADARTDQWMPGPGWVPAQHPEQGSRSIAAGSRPR